MYKLTITAILMILLASCAVDPDKHFPPADAIFTVTDTYLMKDGRHLFILNSNFNRAYDYGRVTVYDIIDKKFIGQSLLIESIGGKMVFNDDETTLYVTSRERNSLQKILVVKDETGIPWIKYAANDLLKDSTVQVQPEPYKMFFDKAQNLLMVTHLRNGEVSLFKSNGIDPDDFLGTFKLGTSITDIIHDEIMGVYIAAQKSSAYLSLYNLTADQDGGLGINSQSLSLNLPSAGKGMRGICLGDEPGTYYVSYRNEDDSGNQYPMILKLRMRSDGSYFVASTEWTAAVSGTTGEITAVPYLDGVTGEMVFVTSTSDKMLYVFDSASGSMFYRYSLENFTAGDRTIGSCSPYQLHYSGAGDHKRLFVSCFQNDMVVVINVDVNSDAMFNVEEVIGG